ARRVPVCASNSGRESYTLGPSPGETIPGVARSASSDTCDIVPRRPHRRGSTLHSQRGHRYACGHGMAGASPPLCCSSLHSVEYFCAAVPTNFFADSRTTKSVSIRGIRLHRPGKATARGPERFQERDILRADSETHRRNSEIAAREIFFLKNERR